MKKARSLRFHVFIPLAILFLLLWAASMKLQDIQKRDELSSWVNNKYTEVASDVIKAWQQYNKDMLTVSDARAKAALTYSLGDMIKGAGASDCGAATAVMDRDGTVLNSHLAQGFGYEEGGRHGNGTGQRWYFFLDEYLDDEGLIDLTQKIRRYSDTPEEGLSCFPAVKQDDGIVYGDGTYARVTGDELEGAVFAIEQLELVRPDGSIIPLLRTNYQSAAPVTKEFKVLRLSSALTSYDYLSYSSVYGQSEEAIRERLAHMRKAQQALPEALGGKTVISYRPFLDLNAPEDSVAGYDVAIDMDVPTVAWRRNHTLRFQGLLLCLATAFCLSLILSSKVTSPLERLCRQVKRGKCKEDSSVAEVNTLATSFNEQQEKMEAQLQRERDFTRAAAHELKTPLAVLRTHVEALQEDILPEKRKSYMNIILEETDVMSDLVSRLLELSRLESGITIERKPVGLAPLVQEVFEPLRLPMGQKNMRLVLELANLTVDGDRQRLTETVRNLAANALRYGLAGGQVSVKLYEEQGSAVLEVSNDTEQPIPEESISHLFEPFYRVDKARSREEGGTGLGLAIVKAAVESHGGSCTVENIPGGVTFRLVLPLSKEV